MTLVAEARTADRTGRRDGGDGRLQRRRAARLRHGQGHRARRRRSSASSCSTRPAGRRTSTELDDGAPARRRPRPRRSATSASRSPTAATSAASTACPPRACRGWTATRSSPTRRSRGWSALLPRMGVHDVRLTGGEPLVRRELWRLVELLARDRGRPRPVADDERLPARAPGRRPRRAPGLRRVNVSLDALAADRFFQLTRRDSLAAGAGGPGGRRAPSRAAPDQGQRRRAHAASPRTRSLRFAEFARSKPVRGALHRVHAARRRPRVGARTGCCPTPRSGRSSSALPARAARPRARTAPRAAGASPTARARSASSPPCRSRSAATATASA